MSEKYCKFAYSSEFGFSVPRSNKFFNQSGADSTLSFEIDGYPFKGIKVETTLIPIEGGHIRRHKVTSDYDCIARDAGFSVSCVDGAECTSFESNGVVTVKNNFSFCSVESTTGGTPEVVSFHPNTSLVYQKTATPFVSYKIKKGITELETIVKY